MNVDNIHTFLKSLVDESSSYTFNMNSKISFEVDFFPLVKNESEQEKIKFRSRDLLETVAIEFKNELEEFNREAALFDLLLERNCDNNKSVYLLVLQFIVSTVDFSKIQAIKKVVQKLGPFYEEYTLVEKVVYLLYVLAVTLSFERFLDSATNKSRVLKIKEEFYINCWNVLNNGKKLHELKTLLQMHLVERKLENAFKNLDEHLSVYFEEALKANSEIMLGNYKSILIFINDRNSFERKSKAVESYTCLLSAIKFV